MSATWRPENRWMRWSLIGGIVLYGWTIFGILSSAHFFLGEEAKSGRASLSDVAAHVLLFYWAWAAVTPFVLVALRRGVDGSVSSARRWATAIIATPAILVTHALIYLLAVNMAGLDATWPIGIRALGDYAMRHGGGDLATIAVLVAVYLLFEARQRAHAREVAAASLETRLASANLEVLRSQLQPHFLFNALNTVSTLVLKQDSAGADAAIGQISRYLRSALVRRADAWVTVAEEIADVQQYFAIERLRFGDGLCLDVQASEEARRAKMPALLLQPLVENAIRHGTSPAARGARIELSATIHFGRLTLCVNDPGAGSAGAASVEHTNGFGLRYVRERLHHYYGDDASLEIVKADAGTEVTVEMPVVAPLMAVSPR